MQIAFIVQNLSVKRFTPLKMAIAFTPVLKQCFPYKVSVSFFLLKGYLCNLCSQIARTKRNQSITVYFLSKLVKTDFLWLYRLTNTVVCSATGSQNEWRRARSTNGYRYLDFALKMKVQEWFTLLLKHSTSLKFYW